MSEGNLLVARQTEWAGAGTTVSRRATAGIAIITRQAGVTVWTRSVVEAVLEEKSRLGV